MSTKYIIFSLIILISAPIARAEQSQLNFSFINPLNSTDHRITKLTPTEIKEITAKNNLTNTYTKTIVTSYSLTAHQLKKMIDNEFASINQDTLRMRQIKKEFPSKSRAYQLINYKLPEQISQEMISSRRLMKKIKNLYTNFLKTTQPNDRIYLIEAKNPELFFNYYQSLFQKNIKILNLNFQVPSNKTISVKGRKTLYMSVFNNNQEHMFTYPRIHPNMLKNRKISDLSDKNNHTSLIYQNSFDNYLHDLKRIGRGLDITNKDLLNQLNDMQDIIIKLP